MTPTTVDLSVTIGGDAGQGIESSGAGFARALMRAGWRRDTLKIGEVITVEGSLAKDGSPTGNARSVVTSTGQRLLAGSSQGSAP